MIRKHPINSSGETLLQFDYIEWFGKNIFFFVLALGALLTAYLVRAFYLRKSSIDDSKLATPTFEEMESGIKISDEDEDP